MPDNKWLNEDIPFNNLGLDLIHPVEDIPQGAYSRLTNIESFQEGVLEPRPGWDRINTAALGGAIHSIHLLANPATNQTSRIIGAGQFLYSSDPGADTVFIERDSGYIVEPFDIVPYKNEFSSKAWAYIGNSGKMRKIDVLGNDFAIGITPPGIELRPPTFSTGAGQVLHALNTAAGWTLTTFAVEDITAPAASPNINVTKPATGIKPGAVAAVLQMSAAAGTTSTIARTIGPFDLLQGFKDDSKIEVFVRPDNAKNIKELHLLINVDADTANFVNANSFKNYYIKIIAGPDLADALAGTQTFTDAIRDRINQNLMESELRRQRLIDKLRHGGSGGDYIPIWSDLDDADLDVNPMTVFGLGVNVWNALSFNRKDFLRVGNDESRTWANANAIMIRVITDSAAVIQAFDWTITGTSSLDSAEVVKYDWRYTYYNANEGLESNPSPVMTSTYNVVNRGATLTLIDESPNDPQITHYRIYRRGGTLLDWHLVEQVAVGLGTTYIDTSSDQAIAVNPILREDNDQPVTSIQTRTNLALRSESFDNAAWLKNFITVTADNTEDPNDNLRADLLTSTAGVGTDRGIVQSATAGTTVVFSVWLKRNVGTGSISLTLNSTSTGGLATWNDAAVGTEWARFKVQGTIGTGTQNHFGIRITANGDSIWAWGAQLETTTSVLSSSGPTDYLKTTSASVSVTDGSLKAAPLKHIFGPFLGRYIFGLLEHPVTTGTDFPINSGRLWWCKPGNADAWPSQNWLDITSPSEPLMNGTILNGKAYVFSRERMFAIYPSLGGGTTFTPLDTACNAGMIAEWALTVGRDEIYFLSATGIYSTSGGPAVSISENSWIRPLFYDKAINGYNYVDRTFAYTRMAFHDPYLDVFYKDSAGAYKILRYHVDFKRWVVLESTAAGIGPRMGSFEEQTTAYLLGTDTGARVYQENKASFNDDLPADGTAVAIACTVRTGALDQKAGRVQKLYGDIFVEYQSPTGATITVTPYLNDEATTLAATVMATAASRSREIIPLGDTGNVGGGVIGRSLSLGFTWSSSTVAPKLYETNLSFLPQTDEAITRGMDWTDLGIPFDKYIWGCSLDVDITGVKSVFIQGDGVTKTTQTIPAFVVNTTLTSGPHSPGTQVFTPASMSGIALGKTLTITPVATGTPEDVIVLATTATTFTATTVNASAASDPITANTGVGAPSRQRIEFSWPVFQAKQVRLLGDATTAWSLYNVEWYFDKEAPQITHWNSYWENPSPGSDVYVWGVEIEGDTTNVAKSVIVERDGGTNLTTANITLNGHDKARLTWAATKSRTLRLYSTSAVLGYLYKVHWLVGPQAVEPPLVTHWDSNWDSPTPGKDFYCWGVEIECDTLNVAKTVGVFRDGAISVASTPTITADGRQTVRMTWPTVKATTMGFTSFTVAARLYKWRWLIGEDEAPLIPHWDSNWDSPTPGKRFYCWGLEIDCDTVNTAKSIVVTKEGGTSVSTQNINANGRDVLRISWPTVLANNLRFTSAAVNGRLYKWRWLTGEDEPAFLLHWDSNFDSPTPGLDFYCWGLEIEADTANFAKSIVVTRDGGVAVSTQNITLNGRGKARITWSTVKATNMRFTSTTVAATLYKWTWLIGEDEMPSVTHWDSNWEAPTPGGDAYVWGLEIECDTGGIAKILLIERDGGTIITSTDTVTATGRDKARITFSPVRARTLRFSSSAVAGRLYRWTWLQSPEPPSIPVWDSNYENDGSLEDKYISGLYLECDTINIAKSISVHVDGAAITGSPFSITQNGRGLQKISIGPVRGVLMRFFSTAVTGRLYGWKWIWEPEPVQLTNFATNWTDEGWPYEKYLKGLSIEADTGNISKAMALRINGDDVTNVATFTIQHNGRNKSFIDFDNILAKTVRIAPTDSVVGRLYKLNFVWDREPISLDTIQTQETSFNQSGWIYLKEGYICLRSTAAVTLAVTIDGTTTNYTLASTVDERRKVYVQFNPVKGKVYKFKLTSTAVFKLYNEDTNVWIRKWNEDWEKMYALPFEGAPFNA